MADSDTAMSADPDVTQPNPATANLEVWKKVVDAATTALAVKILQNPKLINKYADDPGDPPGDPSGTGKGFLKRAARAEQESGGNEWWRPGLAMLPGGSHRSAPGALPPGCKKEPDDDYLGFVKHSPGYEDAVRNNSTGLHGGTTTKSAEEVVNVFEGLNPEEITQISTAIMTDSENYGPHSTQSGLWPDDGSGVIDSATFNIGANLLQAWGAFDPQSFSGGGRLLPHRRVLKNPAGTDVYLALTISELYEEGGIWADTNNRTLLRNDPDPGDYISRPLLANFDPRPAGLMTKTWLELKSDPGVDTSGGAASVPTTLWGAIKGVLDDTAVGLDPIYKHDEAVFVAIWGDDEHITALNEYLQQFIYSIARNFPVFIRDKLHDIVVKLIEDSEFADKLSSAIACGNINASSFTDDEEPEEPATEPEPKLDLKPRDLQCFLMENIGMIADYKAGQSRPYKNLMQLKAGSNDPGDTISILNCKGKQQEVGELLNLAPSTYAALVPYIKLYRLDYTNADDADPMVPIGQQEIPIPNYMDPEDVSRITSGQLGRTSGWGIKSFSWKLEGMQPATVDNNISANLKLYFQSIDDLFKGSRNAAGQDQAGRDMAAPLDLLIPSAACRKKGDADDDPPPSIAGPAQSCVDADELSIAQGRDGACFRIKVVAGWATPPNLEETHPHLKQKVGSETRGQLLRRGLEETRITLYLQQTRHNLTFNENGSCALSIDYQAALSGILTDNRLDILGTNDIYIYEQLKPWKEKAKAAGKDADKIYRRLEASTPQKDLAKTVRNDEGYKAAKKKQKDYVKKQIDFQNQDKLKKYKRFLSRLYGRHQGGASDSPKMYVVEVNPKLLRQEKLADAYPLTRAKRARQLMAGTHQQRGWAITSPLSYEEGKSKENTNLVDLMEGITDLEKATDASDGVSEQFKSNLGSGQNVYIPFFYLGDLIDTILQNNKTAQFGEGGIRESGVPGGFMTFMADMDVTNPLLLYQAKEDEQDDLMCASRSSINSMKLMEQLQAKGYMVKGGVKKRINIGQIPISLDSFNVWFKNKVIKGGKVSYYLLHFLKDICAQLITDALKATCFNTNIINDIRFDLSHVHYNNRTSAGVQIYPDGPRHTVPVKRLAVMMGSSDTRHRDIPPRNIPEKEKKRYNLTSGLVLFCSDEHPRNRLGRKGITSDQNIGIYHNYVGSPVGLVKKIGFTRVQQQYLKEAKIQKYGNLGAEQLRELYSANLELIGNTLYKNGQYTFLWPSAMTTGDDSRIVALGLGGYFMIKSVSHTIGPSGYNVSLTALQEGMEIGPQPTVTATAIASDLTPGEGDWDTAATADSAGAGSPPDENETAAAKNLREHQEQRDETAQDMIAGTGQAADMSPADRVIAIQAEAMQKKVTAGEMTEEQMASSLMGLMQSMGTRDADGNPIPPN